MSQSFEQLKSEVLQLPTGARAELASVLINSLDEGGDAEVEAAWDAELARRMDEIERGAAVGEPAATVFAHLREKYS
jgi:putative addiction module component (TIGR02574 family)